MIVDELTTTGIEEDLAALASSRWEINLITPQGNVMSERRSIAPPTSQNVLHWTFSETCSIGGIDLWRDGVFIHHRYLNRPVALRVGDSATVYYNLMVC